MFCAERGGGDVGSRVTSRSCPSTRKCERAGVYHYHYLLLCRCVRACFCSYVLVVGFLYLLVFFESGVDVICSVFSFFDGRYVRRPPSELGLARLDRSKRGGQRGGIRHLHLVYMRQECEKDESVCWIHVAMSFSSLAVKLRKVCHMKMCCLLFAHRKPRPVPVSLAAGYCRKDGKENRHVVKKHINSHRLRESHLVQCMGYGQGRGCEHALPKVSAALTIAKDTLPLKIRS